MASNYKSNILGMHNRSMIELDSIIKELEKNGPECLVKADNLLILDIVPTESLKEKILFYKENDNSINPYLAVKSLISKYKLDFLRVSFNLNYEENASIVRLISLKTYDFSKEGYGFDYINFDIKDKDAKRLMYEYSVAKSLSFLLMNKN